jgi:hypothetical protein
MVTGDRDGPACANHYLTENAHTADELHEATKDRFECAADDCLLAMWATVPHLAIAVDLLRKRGFRYVSHFVWGKTEAVTGFWNRGKHELLLIGVRGNIPCPAPGEQWVSLQIGPATGHSAKPEFFLRMLEEQFPHLPKIELNRRGKPRPGWASWGNEALPAMGPQCPDGRSAATPITDAEVAAKTWSRKKAK